MTQLMHRFHCAFTRALRADRAKHERVLFHAGDHGRPYVCERPRCGSPSLHVASS